MYIIQVLTLAIKVLMLGLISCYRLGINKKGRRYVITFSSACDNRVLFKVGTNEAVNTTATH